MTIVDWIEAKEHATLTVSKGGKHEWSAPYILTSDNPRDDAQTCVDHMESIGRGLDMKLNYGDREDVTVVCKTIAPQRITGSAVHWQVTNTYAPAETEDDEDKTDEDGNPTDDPLDQRWDISCGTQFVQTPVWAAWNMDPFPKPGATPGVGFTRDAGFLGPVVNSAGIVLDPPLMREVPETVVRITGNVSHYLAAWLTNYAGHINQFRVTWSPRLLTKYGFAVQGWEPYYVLCAGATASFQVSNKIKYWQYTYEFRMREEMSAINPQEGFLETILDRGLTRSMRGGDPDGNGGTISAGDIKPGMSEAGAVRDLEGQRVPEMVLFNGAGQPLSRLNAAFKSGVYFRWRIHPYAEFRALPLEIFAK